MRPKHGRTVTKPKCHTAVAQRMPVIECLSSEWTQKPASPDEAELGQGLPRVIIVDERPDDANRRGLTTIKRLNLELRLEVWLCIPSGIFYT